MLFIYVAKSKLLVCSKINNRAFRGGGGDGVMDGVTVTEGVTVTDGVAVTDGV